MRPLYGSLKDFMALITKELMVLNSLYFINPETAEIIIIRRAPPLFHYIAFTLFNLNRIKTVILIQYYLIHTTLLPIRLFQYLITP